MAGSPPNLHTMDSRSACIQGVLKVKVKVKGHVIRALSWILGMSYSVIDGLVLIYLPATIMLTLLRIVASTSDIFIPSRVFFLQHNAELAELLRNVHQHAVWNACSPPGCFVNGHSLMWLCFWVTGAFYTQYKLTGLLSFFVMEVRLQDRQPYCLIRLVCCLIWSPEIPAYSVFFVTDPLCLSVCLSSWRA